MRRYKEVAVKTRIIKRNGKEVDFDVEKITNAISKANDEMDRIHQLSEYQIDAPPRSWKLPAAPSALMWTSC